MSGVILTILYPIVTPFVAYYSLKYATGIAVDIAIDKTKNTMWYMLKYPFSKKQETDCIKCKCEKCRIEKCNKEECQKGYEILDFTDVKEKID